MKNEIKYKINITLLEIADDNNHIINQYINTGCVQNIAYSLE